jgi:hypothetical protein
MKKHIIAAATILLLSAATAFAESLCAKCRDRSYTKDIGTCVECGGMTSSGAFKLCMKCAEKLQQCQHCRGPLAAAIAPIDTERDGTYRAGRWTYEYSISNKGSRSQGYHGKLLFDGAPVPEPAHINDYYQTPWGPLYWVGQPFLAFGGHGWMPKALVREKVGQALPEPSANTTTSDTPAAEVPGAGLTVWVKMIHPDRTPAAGASALEPWIVTELTQRGVARPGAAGDWTPLGADALTLHDSKHYGLLQARLARAEAGQPFVVEVDGDEPSLELAPQAGAHRLTHCTLTSSVASMEVYLAFKVDAAPACAVP